MICDRYTRSVPTLARFNAAIALGERSKMVEQCLRLAWQRHEKLLERTAIAFMADSAGAVSLVAASAWDSVVGDGLAEV